MRRRSSGTRRGSRGEVRGTLEVSKREEMGWKERENGEQGGGGRGAKGRGGKEKNQGPLGRRVAEDEKEEGGVKGGGRRGEGKPEE